MRHLGADCMMHNKEESCGCSTCQHDSANEAVATTDLFNLEGAAKVFCCLAQADSYGLLAFVPPEEQGWFSCQEKRLICMFRPYTEWGAEKQGYPQRL